MKIADALVTYQIAIPSAVGTTTGLVSGLWLLCTGSEHPIGLATLWGLSGFLAVAVIAGNIEAERLDKASREEWRAERTAWDAKWAALGRMGWAEWVRVKGGEARQ